MIITNDDTETPLWAVGSGRPRPRAVPAHCALCQDPPASAFGLCARCLASAAAEAARLRPRTASSDSSRLAIAPFKSLCRRCGSSRHQTTECPS